MNFNSNNILYNEASFEVFLDTNALDVNEYFNLPKGTFDKDQHIIVCKLPVKTQGFKAAHTRVRNDLINIDCNEKIVKGKHIQYEPYELKGSSFELLIVSKFVNLITLNTPLGETRILAKKVMSYNYSKGKVNRVVFSKTGLSEFCK